MLFEKSETWVPRILIELEDEALYHKLYNINTSFFPIQIHQKLIENIFSFAPSFSTVSNISQIPVIHMIDDFNCDIPSAFDPFADLDAGLGANEYVHIRIRQRKGKKSLTTLEGLTEEFEHTQILKDLKKELCCNGSVIQHKELGKVIQLQGDHRTKVSNFLINAGFVRKESIKIHGF